MTPAEHFFAKGWVRFARDPAIAAWAEAAQPVAARIADDPEAKAAWLRCGGTWFAGVNILPNDARGAVEANGIPPLGGAPLDFIREVLGLDGFDWDPAQISVCYPGYPQPWEGESEAAFRYRRNRDAAHVDGLLRSDPGRRRHLGESHGFILGLPLTTTPPDAAPFVVWEGSHEVMRTAFRARFDGIAPDAWPAQDITDTYVATRREVFETCPRVAIHAEPGEAYIVHRLALHGVAPWGADGGEAPRPIAYFRPAPPEDMPQGWWLDAA